jgi:hypothetical protein
MNLEMRGDYAGIRLEEGRKPEKNSVTKIRFSPDLNCAAF